MELSELRALMLIEIGKRAADGQTFECDLLHSHVQEIESVQQMLADYERTGELV